MMVILRNPMIDPQSTITIFLLGLVPLVYLTYQDLFNNRLVDERQVYYFAGITTVVTAILFTQQGYVYLLSAVGVSVIIMLLFGILLKIEKVDLKLMSSMLTMFWMMNWHLGIFFIGTLLTSTILYLGYNRLVCKPLPRPYLPVLLFTWTVVNLAQITHLFYPNLLQLLS